MADITIQEAQATLPDLIHRLRPGEGIQIVENSRPVAVIMAVPEQSRTTAPRKLGTQPGSVLFMAPDFNAPLDDLKEYME